MNQPSLIHIDPYEIDRRLAELELSSQMFITAAQENFAAFAACTANHPPTFSGTAAWAETNRSLADSAVEARWGTQKSEMNLPLVVNNAKTMAITACSGDKYTGLKDSFPCTRSPKGPSIKDAVKINNQQKFSFMEEPAKIAASIRKPGRQTWIFLVYRDLHHGEVRFELSRPISMADDGHVDNWAERIIFPPTPFDIDTKTNYVGDDDGEQSPEITVEIRRLG